MIILLVVTFVLGTVVGSIVTGLVFLSVVGSALAGGGLHEVDGVSLLVRILHRVERILPGGVRIVVSTTTLPVDDQVAGLATAEGYAVSRGHPTNVSGQFAKAVGQYGPGRREC